MEQFEERLARLSELSGDELSALEQELVEAFEAADTAADLESMQAFADALEVVRQAKSATPDEASTEEVAPEVEAVPASASNGETETEDTPVEEVPAEEVTPEETPAVEEEAAPAEVVEEEAVAASSDAEQTEETPVDETPVDETPEVPAEEAVETPADEGDNTPDSATETDTPPVENSESEESVETNITAEDVPSENSPTTAAGPLVTIRAGGDIPGYTSGTALSGMDEVAEALTKKINAMRGVRGDGEHIVVASMRVEDEVPEERMLRPGDAAGNSRKIRELLSDRDALRPDALTAAAWCAPRAPVYDVPTIGTTNRPVANALPTFTADRGGITWMQPPGVGVGGVGLWRHNGSTWQSFDSPDASDSAATTKPCATVVCGTEQSIDVDAITLCLNFQNMMSRAFPEWVRANTDLVMVQQARFAEQVLLSRMFSVAASGAATPASASQVGAARDFLITVRVAAANFRWTRRLGQNAPLQLLVPSWVGEAMAADLDLQAPGDDAYGTAVSEVTRVFNEINVDPIWYIDDVPGQPAFSSVGAFPAVAHWLLFPTGAFLRLDSGDLNIGVVRDMTHVQANTYSEFSETFETVAYMGPASPNSWVVRGATNIDLSGATGAPKTLTIS